MSRKRKKKELKPPKPKLEKGELREATKAYERNRVAVLSGETYRSQAPSTYRRRVKRSD